MEWFINNWTDIGQAVLAVIGAASLIVKLTPTPKDDAVMGKVKSFVSRFIALNPK